VVPVAAADFLAAVPVGAAVVVGKPR